MFLTNIGDCTTELLSWEEGSKVAYVLVQYLPQTHVFHAGHRYIMSQARKVADKVIVQYMPLLGAGPYDKGKAFADIMSVNLGEDLSFLDFDDTLANVVLNQDFEDDFDSKWQVIYTNLQNLLPTANESLLKELAYKPLKNAYGLLYDNPTARQSWYTHLDLNMLWGGKDILSATIRGNTFGAVSQHKWVYFPTFYDMSGVVPMRFSRIGQYEAWRILYSLKNSFSSFTSLSQITSFLDIAWANLPTIGGKYYIVNPVALSKTVDFSEPNFIFIILENAAGDLCAFDWISINGNTMYYFATNAFIEVE